MVSNGDRGGLVLGHVSCVGQVGCDLCGSGFWVGRWRWVDFNRYVDGLGFFFFFLELTVDYGLLVVVVLGVCSAMVVVIVVLEQKERE